MDNHWMPSWHLIYFHLQLKVGWFFIRSKEVWPKLFWWSSGIIETWNHLSWKNFLSPTVIQNGQLNHVCKCCIYTLCKYLQDLWVNIFPGQPPPMPVNPSGEEIFPNILYKPPQMRLKAISSHPVSCYLGEETDPPPYPKPLRNFWCICCPW